MIYYLSEKGKAVAPPETNHKKFKIFNVLPNPLDSVKKFTVHVMNDLKSSIRTLNP